MSHPARLLLSRAMQAAVTISLVLLGLVIVLWAALVLACGAVGAEHLLLGLPPTA